MSESPSASRAHHLHRLSGGRREATFDVEGIAHGQQRATRDENEAAASLHRLMFIGDIRAGFDAGRGVGIPLNIWSIS